MTKKTAPLQQNLLAAALELMGRQDRTRHPEGGVGGGRRWYPSDEEHQSCCSRVRPPSRAWPWSLAKHCRSAQHVANLLDVDVTELRKAANSIKKEAAQAAKEA